MKKSLLMILALVMAPHAEAKSAANPSIKSLVAQIKQVRAHAKAMARSLEFRPSRNPLHQGEDYSVFISPKVSFQDAELVLDGKIDGVATDLLQPSSNTWVFRASPYSKLQSHTLEITVSVRNSALAQSIRTSLVQLDADILALNVKIAKEQDPQKIAMYTQQRDDKVAQKNALLSDLVALKKTLAIETHSFAVVEAISDPNFPKISTISPATGNVSGGTVVTLSGANFTPTARVKIGGMDALNINVASSSLLTFTTPAMPQGIKDVELILPPLSSGGEDRNYVLANAFYAAPTPTQVNHKPVAVTGAHQVKAIGSEAILNGSASYDPENDAFGFHWTVVSAPSGANLHTGDVLDAVAQPHVTPTAAGFYVFSLVVTETSTPEHFSSDVSLATLEIQALPNHAPVPTAPAISVNQGATATSQVSANDPDANDTFFYAISTNPVHGMASVNASGLVTYSANANYVGNDSLAVTVTDRAGLTGVVSISISVGHVNHAPVPMASAISVNQGATATSQVLAGDPDAGDTFSYTIFTSPAHGTASVSASGLVTFTASANYSGSDSLTITVTDQGGLTGVTSIPIFINHVNHAPAPTAPAITVDQGASATSQIAANDPDAGDTESYAISTNPAHGTASISASGLVTFVANANYVGADSLVAIVTDQGGLSATVTISINILSTAPTVGNLGYSIRTQGGMVKVGMGSLNGVTAPNGSITQYQVNYGDGSAPENAPISGPSAFSIFHDYVSTGNYTATFKVTDNLGKSTTGTLGINVLNKPVPTAKFKSNIISGAAPLTVNFDASAATSSDGPIAQYIWNFGDGTPNSQLTSATASHTFNNPGTYFVRLRTTDGNRGLGEGFTKIYVGVTPPSTGAPAWADMMILPSREVLVNTPMNFDGTRSFDPNPAGSIGSYAWNFNDLFNCADGCTGSGATISYTYTHVYNQFPNLIVTNGAGASSALAGQEIIAVNTGHAPKTIITTPSFVGVAPFTVNASGSKSFDYDGNIQGYRWSFRDYNACPNDGYGCTATTVSASHIYATPGVYLLQLNVTDNDGNVRADYKTITVTATFAEAMASSLSRQGVQDPEREERRNFLTGACATGQANACYFLGEMYAEDGDAFTATKLKEKSCKMGYQAACAL